MKTTIDLDEEKLCRVMKLTGIRTRKRAIDFALTEAERVARIRRVLDRRFYVDASGEVVDPLYDLKSLRDRERPARDSR